MKSRRFIVCVVSLLLCDDVFGCRGGPGDKGRKPVPAPKKPKEVATNKGALRPVSLRLNPHSNVFIMSYTKCSCRFYELVNVRWTPAHLTPVMLRSFISRHRLPKCGNHYIHHPWQIVDVTPNGNVVVTFKCVDCGGCPLD